MLKQLLHRHSAGIEVTVDWTGTECILTVDTNDEHHSTSIPDDKVLDAFNHPYYYINDNSWHFDKSLNCKVRKG